MYCVKKYLAYRELINKAWIKKPKAYGDPTHTCLMIILNFLEDFLRRIFSIQDYLYNDDLISLQKFHCNINGKVF